MHHIAERRQLDQQNSAKFAIAKIGWRDNQDAVPVEPRFAGVSSPRRGRSRSERGPIKA